MTKKKLLRHLKNKVHKLWRECVLVRFDSKCVVCGATKLPNCHHIVSEKLFTYMRYDPDNGITLCPSHHKFGKFSAHKNSLYFVWVVLLREIPILTIAKLVRNMEELPGRFVWTEELYRVQIEALKNRKEELIKLRSANGNQV